MMTYNNANCANLPTTPSPPQEKSWDKRDRAVKAAILALGPQAIPEFDFTIIKCDKRWMWRAIAADKRPPVSDAQIKANGGKKAISAYTALTVHVCPDCGTQSNALVCHCTKAGEAVASAAVEKIMANAKKPVDTTEDSNGFPVFLKRAGNTSAEAQEALIAKHKKTTGPDRQIKNPPDAKAAKKRAEKVKGEGVGFVARQAILAGKTNAEALAAVMSAFPKCSSNAGCMGWYRNDLRKKGLLKGDKARPTKKAAAK